MIVVAIEVIPYRPGQLQEQTVDPSALGLYRNPGDCRCGPSLYIFIHHRIIVVHNFMYHTNILQLSFDASNSTHLQDP